MFFYIGKNCPFNSLTEIIPNTYLDKGWDSIDNIYYKGYSTDCNLSENIYKIVYENYRPAGKWCVISNGYVYHPKFRGFPIYKLKNGALTNIILDEGEMVFYDKIPVVDESSIDLKDISFQIGNILYENIYNFLSYNKNVQPLNVLYSMGLDSLTCWAIIDNITSNYNLHIHLPKLQDMNNYQDRMGVKREYNNDLIEHMSKKHWGYEITSIYNEPNYYMTGFYSERIQLREVNNGHALAKYLGTELYKMVTKKDYLYYFLHRPKLRRNNCEQTFTTEKELKNYCYDSIFYDYQMWHIDNNLHFSPFFDVRIAQLCYRLSIEDWCKNAANAVIQRSIIERFNPTFLTILADYKNEKNIWANFNKNFDKIKLNPNININIT